MVGLAIALPLGVPIFAIAGALVGTDCSKYRGAESWDDSVAHYPSAPVVVLVVGGC